MARAASGEGSSKPANPPQKLNSPPFPQSRRGRHEHPRQPDPPERRRSHPPALRHRRLAVRRPRRRHQRDAPAHPVAGRRGHPPRAQPLGRGRGARRAAGRRRRHRAFQLPGRPHRVLQVHGGHAQGARRWPHPRVRRRRRHHHAGGDRRAAGLRRGAHLPPERRHADGPRRDDRRPRAPRAPAPPAHAEADGRRGAGRDRRGPHALGHRGRPDC